MNNNHDINKEINCTIIPIFEKIQLTSSRLEKEKILREQNDFELFKDLLEYIYNPFKVYGIGNKCFRKTKENKLNNINNTNNIIDLFNYLITHNTGSDECKDMVNNFINTQPENTRQWYQKMILKDLKIGVTTTTINKMFKDLIPTFSVMLANPFEKISDDIACEVKIDGVRCLTIKQNNSVTMFTRNGKLIEGFNEIIEQIKKIPIDTIVFDGEIIGKDYTDTMNKLFKKNENKKGTYMIIYMLTLQEFNSGISNSDYLTRKKSMLELTKDINPNIIPNLKFIQPVKVLQKPKLEDLNEIMNIAVKDGYEGIMIKSIYANYSAKRSKDWQKLKPFLSDEFEIVDFEVGTGKYNDTLGKVIINVDGTLVGVGSGFSDDERNKIWNNKEKYLNQLIEVQYQEKIEKTHSLRFPTVKSIRLDK